MNSKHFLIILVILSVAIMIYARVGQKPFVERSECVNCGDCTRVCPTGAISIVDGRASIDEELCIDCKFCVQTCTYRAIKAVK